LGGSVHSLPLHRDYDATSDSYPWRLVVRAMQVAIQ
jgi:hypothetical protein